MALLYIIRVPLCTPSGGLKLSTTEKPTFKDELGLTLQQLHGIEDILNHGAFFEELCQKAREDTDRARVFFLWGTALARQGHCEEAAKKFAEGLALEGIDKPYITGRLQLAVAKTWWIIGDLDEARKYSAMAAQTLKGFAGSSELTDAQLLSKDIYEEINASRVYPGLGMRHKLLLSRNEFPLSTAAIR